MDLKIQDVALEVDVDEVMEKLSEDAVKLQEMLELAEGVRVDLQELVASPQDGDLV